MKRTIILSVFALLLCISAFAQRDIVAKVVACSKNLQIKTTPATAEIVHVLVNGAEEKLGVGGAEVRIDKDEDYQVEVRKEGWEPVRRIYQRQKGALEEDNVVLENRLVKVNASPSDARIYVDNVQVGYTPQEVVIPKGQSKTIDVKKPGFKTLSKVYYNQEGHEEPEISHLFKLEDRLVSIKTSPNDAKIMQDGKSIGEGNADLIVKKDNCVNITVERAGYVSSSVNYCNKENEKEPPMNSEITLKDRVAQFNVMPESAAIYVDGKQVAKGSYQLKIPYGSCVEMMMYQEGYARERMTICNKSDWAQPEVTYPIKLSEDEAYTQSAEESSDKANRNFGIEVNPKLDPVEAWKKLASIVYQYFEEIETQDATTSYLRTNWVSSQKLNAKKSGQQAQIIRTKVVVTSAGTNPLKYNIKIFSEISKTEAECMEKGAVPPISKDECFESFPRILRKYNDLIHELQLRLSNN